MADIRSELLKKYGKLSNSSGDAENSKTQNTPAAKDLRSQLLEKHDFTKVKERKDKVRSWAEKYNRTIKGINDYSEKRNGGYTLDVSGGFDGDIDDLITEFADIEEYAGQMGLPNVQRYKKQLAELRDGIKKENEFMSQFESEEAYNAFKTDWEHHEYLSNLDQNDAQKEISILENALTEYLDLSRWQTDEAGAARLEELKKQYGGERELRQLISQKTQELNQAKHIQHKAGLADVADPESDVYDLAFEKLSGYVSTQKEDAKWWETGVGDTQYEWINNRDGFRETFESGQKEMTESMGGTYSSEYQQKHYDRMTDSEIAIYNYYYAKDGKAKAQEFLDSIQEDLNMRSAQARFRQMDGKTAVELVFAAEAGVEQWKSGMAAFLNTEADYIPASDTQMLSQMVREDMAVVGDNLPEWMGGGSTGQMVYDVLNTAGNMAPSILTSVAMNLVMPGAGAMAGGTMMGMSAAGNAYQEMLNEGYSKDQARGYSLLVGGSEMALESILGGISNLGGNLAGNMIARYVGSVDTALKAVAVKIGGSVLSEFTEEYLQEILTPVFKNLTLLTDEEVKLFSPEAFYSGILGAMTGAVMEGPGAVTGAVKTGRQGQQLMDAGIAAKRLQQIGHLQSADSVAYRLAGRVNENSGAYAIGRLFNELDAEITQSNMADITAALVRRGMDQETAQKNAEVFAAVAAGAQLSDFQQAVVEHNDVLADAVRETIIDPNSTVNQRSQGYREMLKELAKETASRTDSLVPGQAKADEAATQTDKNVGSEKPAESVEGKTIHTASGQSVEVDGFTAGEDGTLRLALSNGSDAALEDISFGSEDQAVIAQTIAGLEGLKPMSANALFHGFIPEGGISALEYAKGTEEAYRYGYYGYSKSEMMSRGVFARDLTEQRRQNAYRLGQLAQKSATEAKENALRQKDQGSAGSGVMIDRNGEMTPVDKAGLTLDGRRSAAVETARVLTELGLGGRYVFFQSKKNAAGEYVYTDRDGNEVAVPNGMYYRDGTIYVDLNAGKGGSGMALFTLSHELTHFIEQWSPKKYRALAEFLTREYARHGVSVDELVHQKQKELGGEKEISYDRAYHEVIADSMEKMFADGNLLEKLVKLKSEDRSLFRKMKGYIDKLTAKIQEHYGKLDPQSAEGRMVGEMGREFGKIQDKFAEALVDASKTYQSIGGRDLTEFAAAQNRGGEALFQYRAMEADTDTYREMLHKWGGMSHTQIKNLFSAIDKALDVIKDNLEALDYAWEADIDDRAFSPVKPNSDSLYQVSLDFSTLCRKRILQQTVQAQLQQALNKPLTREEGIAIRDALIEIQKEGRQIEVACALCYVESARMKSPEQIRRFVENREKVIKDFFASRSGGNIKAKIKQAEQETRARLGVGDTPLKQLPGKAAAEIRSAKKAAKEAYKPTEEELREIEYAKSLTVHEFTSPEGLEELAKKHKDLFDAYTSYIRNATKSKGIENDTWFRAGDSRSISDTLIENMNRENGLRSQSWSDFQVIHILDYIAATIEMATRNAKEQAYTKVPDYVELMGLTGVMINMSLIPTAEFDGTLRYDSVEGIDYKRALELREKYPDTAGTICIGMNNEQIRLMLADGAIDYVIPYHRSGMAKHIRKAMHIPTWDEYQDYQSEKKLSRAAAKVQAEKYNVKLLEESDPNYQKRTSFSEWFDLAEARKIAEYENRFPSDEKKRQEYGVMYGGYMAMKQAGDNYLRLCAERGLSPKFSHEKADFTSEDNYWKLLIDRKMVNNATGEIIEQRAIKPIFDEGEILRILNDELERYGTVKADQEYAIRRVTEKYLSGELTGGMSANAVAKVMQKPVDNVAVVSVMDAMKDAAVQKQARQKDGFDEYDIIEAVYTIRNEKAERNRDLIEIGTMPSLYRDLLDLNGKIYVSSSHLYMNMVSKKVAETEGRPPSKSGADYHELGEERVINAIEQFQEPVLLMESLKDFNEPRLVALLDEKGNDGQNLIAVLELYAPITQPGVAQRRNHVLMTIYEKNSLPDYIEKTVDKNRLLYMRKGLRTDAAAGLQLAGAVSEETLKKNLARFNKKVKAFRKENNISYQKRSSTDPVATLERVNEKVTAENARLKEDVAYLKELLKLQRTVTGGTKFTRSSVDAMARILMKENWARGDERELGKILNSFYEYIARSDDLTWESVKEQAQAAVDWLLDHMSGADAAFAFENKMYEADLLRQVYDGYWRVSTLRTAADIKQKQISKLKAEHKQRMDVLKENHRQSIADLKKHHQEKLSSTKKTLRENAERKHLETVKKYQEAREKGIDSRRRTEMRHKVQKVVKELNDYLLKGSKERHVPIGLQKATAEILDALNMDTVGAEERITKLKEQLVTAKNADEALEISRKIERIQKTGERFREKMEALHRAYEEIKNDDDPLMTNAYDEGLSAHMMTLIVEVGDTPLKDMNLSQLEKVYDVCRIVQTTIRNANKAFRAAKNASIDELAGNVMNEVETVGGKRQYSATVMEAIRKFGWNNLKPVYAFEHIGSKTFSEVFRAVRNGEDVWARNVTQARTFYLEKAKKYGLAKWDMGQWHEFTSASGMDFSLNLGQIMSLYAYSKREQAAEHIRRGGIVIDESTEITMKTKLGLKVKFNPTEATAYNITDDTLADIISKLTPEQKAFADEMQKYLSETMGEKGNEVSLQMYGIKLFKEQNYFPLRSASQYMAKAREQQAGDAKIKNAGFSKEVVKKANNPIVLDSFLNVWASHVNEMSMYHAFVLPLEDFYRVYNFRTPTSDKGETKSVNAALQNAYGRGATQYIEQLLKDLNGGARVDSTTDVISKGMNLFKKGSVFASASVVIQQPSAIVRAAAMIDPKHFIGPRMDSKKHKLLWDEVKQYAPVAVIKEMGYFDTNVGKSTEDFLLGQEYESLAEQMTALVTDEAFRDEILSKAPALADELTWCCIWSAVKREIREKHPGMDVKSEEFLKMAGERFTDVIVKTQVYDSVLSRSANMRSKDTGMKMATAFMAEPTTAINMVADALLKGKRGDKKAVGRTVGAVIAAQIFNSFLVSFVYAARDDDEVKSYWEKYLTSFVSGTADGINPATYIPFVKDMISIAQGYDVERSDMAVISDLRKGWEQLWNDDVSAWRKVETFAGSVCQLFGLPVKNIMRDVRAAWQAFETIFHGEMTTGRGIGYAIREGLTGDALSNKHQLYEARMAGDEAHAKRVEARYDDEDSANAAVKSAIRENFMDGKLDIQAAQSHLILYAGASAAEAHWTMDEWEYAKETGSTDGYGKYTRFYDAVQSGENLEDVVQDYVDNGVTKSTLSGLLSEHFKPQYMSATGEERAQLQEKILTAYEHCGYDRERGEEKLADWEFEAEYGFNYYDRKSEYLMGNITAETLMDVLVTRGGYSEEDAAWQVEAYEWDREGIDNATTAAVRNYYAYCAEANVPKAMFMRIRTFSNNTENDVDENGDKIPYSAVRKVMEQINNLDITNEQKDALARSMGWKESTIKKYKLW